MSDGGSDCVTVGDFYGGGDFDGGLDGSVGGCSRVAVAVMLIFHIAGIHIAGLNAPKTKPPLDGVCYVVMMAERRGRARTLITSPPPPLDRPHGQTSHTLLLGLNLNSHLAAKKETEHKSSVS